MSTFKVSVEVIDKVWNHPNADRLDLASVEGMSFQFVVGRDQYKIGDRVIYFPVDSLLPEHVIATMGLTGKLSGKAKNRVKTIKLRGEISQGLVGDPAALIGGEIGRELAQGDDLTEALGVTKYEAPQPGEPSIPGAGRQSTLPENVSHYDLEGCDRYKAVVEDMMNWPVLVMEKLEGSNTAITRYPDGRTVVCSRNHALITPEDIDTCRWHKGCKNSGLFDAVKALQDNAFPGKQVTIRGELLGPGVQDNIYKLDDYQVLAFEIEIDGKPLCGQEFLVLCFKAGINHAPVLSEVIKTDRAKFGVLPTLCEHLKGRTTAEASNGFSALKKDQMREGIVIRPWLKEHNDISVRGLGRPILKHRSPEYLAKSEL